MSEALPEHVEDAFDAIRDYGRDLRFQLAVLRDSRLTPAEEAARMDAEEAHR